MSQSVLVVDDSLTVRMDLCDALSAAGLRPLACSTCEQARALIAAERPRAAILDVVLPDGMGTELLHELRSQPETRDTIVLMLTSEAELKDRTHGLSMGANEYVGKPYDTGYLLARLLELLGDVARPERRDILVIDDSATYREALREILRANGQNVVLAESGEEGLRVLAARRVDAAIVDGVLPGIDGASVIRRIRLDPGLRALPCLLLTADDHSDAELRALDAGADAFVRKSEEHDVILAKLHAVLRSSAKSDATPPTHKAHRVLLVDDDAKSAEKTAQELRAESWDVVGARSGEEALDLLAVQRVDCVLMALPFAASKALCLRIKAAPIVRDVPFVLMAGTGEHEEMVTSLASGADDYLPKPSAPAVLIARVRAQLRRKEFADEHLRNEREAQEAKASRELAETRGLLISELERKSAELEAFSYSVSHDLRAPLRAILGFSQALQEDHAQGWPTDAQDLLKRVRGAAVRMEELITDLLQLSRVSAQELDLGRVDLSEMAASVLRELQQRQPERTVDVHLAKNVAVQGDAQLLRVVLENLLGNSWKFTARTNRAEIHLEVAERGTEKIVIIRDNGAGFDMAFAHKLFRPFQRLHAAAEFPGTGVGLATVQRVIERHGGRIWAESSPGQGAAFLFTIPGRRAGR